jgi:hypothetical protein
VVSCKIRKIINFFSLPSEYSNVDLRMNGNVQRRNEGFKPVSHLKEADTLL